MSALYLSRKKYYFHTCHHEMAKWKYVGECRQTKRQMREEDLCAIWQPTQWHSHDTQKWHTQKSLLAEMKASVINTILIANAYCRAFDRRTQFKWMKELRGRETECMQMFSIVWLTHLNHILKRYFTLNDSVHARCTRCIAKWHRRTDDIRYTQTYRVALCSIQLHSTRKTEL